MRRRDREITDRDEIIRIMSNCEVIHIAFHGQEYPYVIPFNFGMRNDNSELIIYLHGAKTGTKYDLLAKNNKVGFAMECRTKLITSTNACEYTMEYESVCGNGEIVLVTSTEEKLKALTRLMKQYDKGAPLNFTSEMVEQVGVMKLIVNEISGKRLKTGK